jgi:hypothetical protein
MAAMRRSVLAITALLSLLATATGVAAQSLTPHSPGWERYFTVSWEPFERRGKPYLNGYIVSNYGVTATRVQLLVDSLDSSGQIAGQRVEWLSGGNLPGFARTYFEVPIRQRAATYRVSVFAFDFVQSAQIESP